MSEHEDQFFGDVQRQGRQMAMRICQAFPELSRGQAFNEFEVRFAEHDDDLPIANTIYEKGVLTRIELDQVRINEQYSRLNDQVAYMDLVRVHVGVGISMDLLFQHTMRQDIKGTNVAIKMVEFMGNQERIRSALKEVDPASGYTDLAVQKLLYGRDPLDEEKARAKAVKVNAQRLAFGMTLVAENMYGSESGPAVVAAVREDITTQVTSKAVSIALLGHVLTNDLNVAMNAAAETIVAIRDLPFAIPASRQEIDSFLHAIQVANIRPEILGAMAIEELSDGRDDVVGSEDLRSLGEDTDGPSDDQGDGDE